MSEKAVASAIEEMIDFLLPYCEEKSTLVELKKMSGDESLWEEGHDLFSRIRNKTLQADKTGNKLLQYQYSFEEICAKSLFNFSGCEKPAPFDDDAPFWVIPIAVGFARFLGVNDPHEVTRHLT